jgi:anthranilate phosphoribosyltransferase
LKELQGGSADENAVITRNILKGQKGPKRDIVCLNAAAALIAGGKAKGWQDGFHVAGTIIDSGAAMEKLEQLIQFTNT